MRVGRKVRIESVWDLVAPATVLLVSVSLVPLLTPAARQAQSSTADRLQAVSRATLLYVNDYEGDFPVGCGAMLWQPKDGGWYYSVKPYMAGSVSLLSARDRWHRALWPTWLKDTPASSDAVPMSLSSNGMFKEKDQRWGMYGVMGIDQGPGTGFGGFLSRGRTKMSEIHHPNDTVLFAERYGSYAIFSCSNVFVGTNWWDSLAGVGNLIPNGTASRHGRGYLVEGTIFSVDDRNGGMNAGFNVREKQGIAFADGHVAMMPPVQTDPDSIAHPELNKWDIEH